MTFPLPLDQYPAASGLGAELAGRIARDPFNLVATLLFLGAIAHTFLAPALLRHSHHLRRLHRETAPDGPVPVRVEVFHFLGEIEAVFGIWVIPLALAAALMKGWGPTKEYLAHGVDFTEALFIVVIMVMAASRPILSLAERGLGKFGGSSPARWWWTLLTLGPLLGSFITEPAAMTICAVLLGKEFFRLKPGRNLRYSTLGLLFVNISVGGTLSHFAAPPVLMVAAKWGWGLSHLLLNFGWKAVVGILVANLAYFLAFHRELLALRDDEGGRARAVPAPVPFWITAVHIGFIVWTVVNNHAPVLFVGGFLFFLAFLQATGSHQKPPDLRPPVLVGFFLAGLVVHGGLQGWWIAPVLGRLGEVPLLLGSCLLTAFNDNAAITFLATLVPNLSDVLKEMVVAGAVAGGGLTVIANAPNPAGQAILGRYFPGGISPLGLACGAAVPTGVMLAAFYLLR